MRLKVICQVCGRTATVSTMKFSDDWEAFSTTELWNRDDIREEFDITEDDVVDGWDFWVCRECLRKLGQHRKI